MRFVIYQDNGGRFHWSLDGEDGVSVAVSATGFSSRGDAKQAATQVHLGAGFGHRHKR